MMTKNKKVYFLIIIIFSAIPNTLFAYKPKRGDLLFQDL